MPENLTPRHVVAALMQRISDQSWDGLEDFYAEDAVIEYPFALPAPMRLEGRPAIARYFAAVARAPVRLRARDMIVRETADPEVVVAEWNYDGLVTTTGATFEVANIQVSTIRDGRIAASRDYHNHAALAAATGQLTRLAERMSGSPQPPSEPI
ncbi:MAG TPA: nuclear transport factor 2 family protein [Streptosporangiaceae bacterium]